MTAHLLDTSSTSYLPLSVEPKTDPEGTQKKNRDGTPLWTVNALHQPTVGKPSVVSITVPSPAAPSLTPMTPATWAGLRVDIWQSGDSSGLWFAADSVAPLASSRRAE